MMTTMLSLRWTAERLRRLASFLSFLPSLSSYASRTYTSARYTVLQRCNSLNLQRLVARGHESTHVTNARTYTRSETRTHTYAHLTRHSEVRWKPRTLFSESIESLHRPASGHLRSAMTTCTYYARFVADNTLHDAPLGRRSSPPRVIVIIPRTRTPPAEARSPHRGRGTFLGSSYSDADRKLPLRESDPDDVSVSIYL